MKDRRRYRCRHHDRSASHSANLTGRIFTLPIHRATLFHGRLVSYCRTFLKDTKSTRAFQSVDFHFMSRLIGKSVRPDENPRSRQCPRSSPNDLLDFLSTTPTKYWNREARDHEMSERNGHCISVANEMAYTTQVQSLYTTILTKSRGYKQRIRTTYKRTITRR